MNIKLVVTDIDGVWTDGGMYYDETGNEWKKFHTYDSAGVLLLRELGVPVAIVTGENTAIVSRRAKKLGIAHVFQGARDKLAVVRELCTTLGVTLAQVGYVGDDLNDVPAMREVGLSAAPSSAPEYVRSEADWVLASRGGEGAFREFVERLLSEHGLLRDTVERLLAAADGKKPTD